MTNKSVNLATLGFWNLDWYGNRGQVRRTTEVVSKSRHKPWRQDPEFFKGNLRELASNGRWDGYGIGFANDSILSMTYEVGWYAAGAAHPNSRFETYNFNIASRLLSIELIDLFHDEQLALNIISQTSIEQIKKEYWERTGEAPDKNSLEWIQNGATPNRENFSAFTIGKDGLSILFSPYQVAAYALGRWSVDISYFELKDALVQGGIHRLASGSH